MTVEYEYSPLEMFSRVYRRLWIVGLLTVVGGLAGLLFQYIKPPVYEARAEINAVIDFKQTGAIEELAQDQLVGAVVALIQSPDTFAEVNARLQSEGIKGDHLVLHKDYFVERKRSSLYLIVRSKSADEAAAIANTWADAAFQTLAEAYDHAVLAQSLREYLQTLETCPQLTGTAPGQPNLCAGASLDDINAQVQQVAAAISEETRLSRGIVPALSFDLTRYAEPGAPVARDRGILLMASALAGFFLGVLLTAWKGQKPGMPGT